MYVATVMSIQRNYADHAPRKQGGDVGEVEQPHGDDTLTPDSDEERYEMYGEVVGFARNGKGMVRPSVAHLTRSEPLLGDSDLDGESEKQEAITAFLCAYEAASW